MNWKECEREQSCFILKCYNRLHVRTEGIKKKQGGYWILQPRFVEHKGKKERKI